MQEKAMNALIALPQWAALPDIGLYMDQVMTLMERTFEPGEITKSMVNNYVKVGLIKRPAGKKYDREQLAQLVMIGVLKKALSMEDIARTLSLLCDSGIQEGYERFIALAEQVMAVLGDGCAMESGAEDIRERAVRSAIAAAVCAMHARRLLALA